MMSLRINSVFGRISEAEPSEAATVTAICHSFVFYLSGKRRTEPSGRILLIQHLHQRRNPLSLYQLSALGQE